ncbi:MAG: hypothetical protein FJ264_15290 [Planctomycetes bacterium]|nr:hypothetical protein [Planctomycetota bacterium]
MLKRKRYLSIVTVFGAMLISGNVMAHTTVMSKNTPDNYSSRDELEGTTSLNHFSIPHGCAGQPVKAQSVVFPNGADSIAERSDTGDSVTLADHIEGNPIMGAKPAVNSLFKKVEKLTGTVPAFTSHGSETTEDTRAFVYTKGKLEDGYLGLLPWTATFPTFKSDSCVTALTVYIAIANYCTKSTDEDDDDRADIWMGRTTEKFDDEDVVSVDFWPYLKIVRDLETNPIDESCGEGFEISVYPSDEAIDEYLPVDGYWPAKSNGDKNGKDDDDDHGDHKGHNH